ncbi:unnamed protein product [Discula destructiva]
MRHENAARRDMHGRQDGATCPAVGPVDCNNGMCCPLSSECLPKLDGGTGCVVSNNQGQTVTVMAFQKTGSPPTPTTSGTLGTTLSPSTPTPVPTTKTTSTAPPLIATPTSATTNATSRFITSVPIATSTTTSFVTSRPVASPVYTISPIVTNSAATTLISSSASQSAASSTGAIGIGILPPASSSAAETGRGAHLGTGETTALIATPIAAIAISIIVYCLWWRRRRQRPTTRASEAISLQDSPRREYEDDYVQSMTERPGLIRHMASMGSVGTQPSMATTSETLLRGPDADQDGGGPLRSHPFAMLGAMLRSPARRTRAAGEAGAFKKAAAATHHRHESGKSSVSTATLTPFRQEYGNDNSQYWMSPARYNFKNDGCLKVEANEVAVKEWHPSVPKRTKRFSWMSKNPPSRQRGSSGSSVYDGAGGGTWDVEVQEDNPLRRPGKVQRIVRSHRRMISDE